MITNGKEDKVPGGNKTKDGDMKPECREALSFCGALDAKYPDSKPMGYPFDRKPFTVKMEKTMQEATVKDLDEYVSRIENMGTTIV